MSRFKILAANPRRALAALATVLVAVGITGASGADFNAQTANPGNTFASGALDMYNSKDGVAVLTSSGMAPGDKESGEVRIENTGTVSGDFTLRATNVTNSDGAHPMAAKLNLDIVDCGADMDCADTGDNSSEYSGTVAGMTAIENLGNWAEDETHLYEFTVELDGSADDDYENDNSSVRFQWDAVS